MSQLPSVPPPPPPSVPAAQSPSAVVAMPGGPIPLEALPRTAEQVVGLRARREILRDQLSRATNRREQLVNQLRRDGADEARPGIQQRLAVLDERIIQIEREQAATERLLSNASPEVLASTAEPRNQGAMVGEGKAIAAASGAFGAGVLLTLLLGRVWRALARRRAGSAPMRGAPAGALAGDPRIERLTQSVDAIAEEVERIGEGQRFVTQLLAGRQQAAALGGAELEPRRPGPR